MTEAERIESLQWPSKIELPNENEKLRAENERLQKLIKEAYYWANEQTNTLNALADKNVELSSELTKANNNYLLIVNDLKSAQELNRELVGSLNNLHDFMQRNIPSVQSGVWPHWLNIRDKIESLINKSK